MSKIFKSISFLGLFLFSAAQAYAQESLNPCPDDDSIAAQACRFNAGDFGDLVGTLIQAIFVIAVVIALGYLIYGAIRWIISQGDKGKVTDARNHIIAAIIGLVIVFLSFFIINIILSIFFGQNLTTLELPTLAD